MITVEQIRPGLVKAVEAKGENYVYETVDEGACYYEWGGEPSCLVGHAIFEIEPTAFWDLAHEEKLSAADGLAIKDARSVHLEPLARSALSVAQTAQDGGRTWGEALAAFDAYVEGCAE